MAIKQIKENCGMLACASLLVLASLHFVQQVSAAPVVKTRQPLAVPALLQQAHASETYIPVIMRKNNSFEADIKEFSRVMMHMNKVVSNRQKIMAVQPAPQQKPAEQKEDVGEFASSVVKDVVREEVKDFLFKVSLVGRIGEFAANYFAQD